MKYPTLYQLYVILLHNYFSNLFYRQFYYTLPNFLFILLSGDIKPNPGPHNHLLLYHPNDHKLRNRICFTHNLIQLKPEYQYISINFASHLIHTHPQHQATHQIHPFLHRFITQHNQYPPPLILYILIVTISPLSIRYNLLLFQSSLLIHLLLQRIFLFTQNPYHTLSTPHPYTQFLNNNQELMTLPTTIHSTLYEHISQSNPPANFDSIKILFPYLPDPLIHKALRCTQPLLGYIPPPPTNHPTIPRINNNAYTTLDIHFTTWNISSLNTSLPCLHSFLETHTPAILTLQETKLTAKKSPKYLQWMFFPVQITVQ